ncbi:MAG: polysaccharide biosynthesis protein [Nitrososphaerota archaeon]|nr:polysaccharide biosynthesis protein [Nitrososphaerota archaeon]
MPGRPSKDLYRGATILITGGTGSVGLELTKAVIGHGPREVRIFSNDENGLFEARSIFGNDVPVKYHLGDVRDPRSIERAIAGCDLVFHAAALKHVDFCEMNPYEAISTNIIGAQNVIELARKERVDKLVYVSTDKAVNPVSAMGATKLLSERLTVNAGLQYDAGIFCCVRFGNILGSRGSVLTIFDRQVREGKRVTITNPRMTRFIMLPSEAAGLILHAAEMAKPSETYVLKMPAVRVKDLAEASIEFFCRRYGRNPADYRVEEIGANPEEKIHEELMTDAEQARSSLKGDFYVIPSPGSGGNQKASAARGYSSESAKMLSKQEIVRVIGALYASS